MNQQNLTYKEFQQLLDENQYLITVSEIQGLLMGFYAAGLDLSDNSWKLNLNKQLSVKSAMPDMIETEFRQMNQSLREMITAHIFGLEMRLPEDDSSTVERGEALGYWCQGFLLGYMQVTENKEEADEDVADALTDLEDISNLDLDTIGSSEEDEKSLFELTEHIKVAAQMIHSVNGQTPSSNDDTMH